MHDDIIKEGWAGYDGSKGKQALEQVIQYTTYNL